jgi:hypothetical protein
VKTTVLALALLAVTATFAVWVVGSVRKQECLTRNLSKLELVQQASDRVSLDGSKPLSFRAQYPGAERC